MIFVCCRGNWNLRWTFLSMTSTSIKEFWGAEGSEGDEGAEGGDTFEMTKFSYK